MDDNHNDFVGVMPQLGALPTNCPDPDPDGITVKRWISAHCYWQILAQLSFHDDFTRFSWVL